MRCIRKPVFHCPQCIWGGDEVPHGVWMGSPKCQELMKEKGMTKAHDLSEYFITQMADVMQKNGLEIQWLAGSCFGGIPKRLINS